jgi:hypothetical protein
LERLASGLNHSNAKGTGCDISRKQTYKTFHFGLLVGWSFGLVGSAPDGAQKLVTPLATLRQQPGSCVDWCGLLPMRFSRSAAEAAQEDFCSSFLQDNIFSPISQEEKLKTSQRRTPPSARGYGCKISAPHHQTGTLHICLLNSTLVIKKPPKWGQGSKRQGVGISRPCLRWRS